MKLSKRVVSLLSILSVTGILLAGCGKTDLSESAFCGTWKAGTASYQGMKEKVSSLLGEYKINLKADGTVTVTLNDVSAEGTWEESEQGVSIHGGISGGMELSTTSSGNLILKQDDVKVTFHKE